MIAYYLIESGQIVEGPRALPRSWRNVSGLDRASPERLCELGWLPQRLEGFEPFNPATQVRAHVGTAVATDEVIDTYVVRAMTPAELAPSVKAEAQRRINLVIPPEDQVAAVTRGVELLDKGKANWTAAELAEAQALRAIQARARELRESAKALLAALPGMTPEEIAALDVSDDAHWPE